MAKIVLCLLWKESQRFSRNWENFCGSESRVQNIKGDKGEFINPRGITQDLKFNTLAKALGNNVSILLEWFLEAWKKVIANPIKIDMPELPCKTVYEGTESFRDIILDHKRPKDQLNGHVL